MPLVTILKHCVPKDVLSFPFLSYSFPSLPPQKSISNGKYFDSPLPLIFWCITERLSTIWAASRSWNSALHLFLCTHLPSAFLHSINPVRELGLHRAAATLGNEGWISSTLPPFHLCCHLLLQSHERALSSPCPGVAAPCCLLLALFWRGKDGLDLKAGVWQSCLYGIPPSADTALVHTVLLIKQRSFSDYCLRWSRLNDCISVKQNKSTHTQGKVSQLGGVKLPKARLDW